MPDTHTMVFEKFGGTRHLRIRSAADLRRVLALDDVHWVATGAPISSLNCDGTFLEFLDVDHNGRILCFEVRLAIGWLLDCLRDWSGIDSGATILRLDALNTENDDGRRIHSAASRMLAQLGAESSGEITLDQARRIRKQVEEKPISATGVVLAEAAADENIQKFLQDVICAVGGAPHPSGRDGVSAEKLDEFLKQSKLYLEWRAGGMTPEGEERSDIAPLGAATEEAFAVYSELYGKIEEYFAQCRLAAFEKRALNYIKPMDIDLQSLNLADADAVDGMLRACPLARPTSERSLPLARHVNPAYESQLAQFRDKVVGPALGRAVDALSEQNWTKVRQFFAARQAWMNSKPGGAVEKLGAAKLTEYQREKYESAAGEILKSARNAALVLDNIRLVEKIVLYQANMLNLVNNFVSFPLLYDPEKRALFEMGTLVIDGRCLNFSVKVENRAEHSSVAKTSDIFVIYVEVAAGDGGKKYDVALPVTSGAKGNLCVGKRGVFRDLRGNMLDARVAQIIENPISIYEAIVSPFQRMGKLLTGKIEAITIAAEKGLDTATAGALERAQPGGQAQAPGAPQGKGLLAGGLLMGGGVAVAALGSAAAYITNTLKGIAAYKIVIGLVLAVIAVIMPASLIALIKLQRRDLSAILEGCGWAINPRMRLTMKQGRIFTRAPRADLKFEI